MELFYRRLGKGKPLVILHGLYGSSDNWFSIGKHLSAVREVYLVDIRNHGQSPHHPVHNYTALRDDLHEFLVEHSLFKPVIMGHSMGGRAAMYFAARHPRLIEKLIIVDISPCSYKAGNLHSETRQHERIVQALQSIDLDKITSRAEADRKLAETIQSPAIRQFLLKNLKTGNRKKFHWCLNLPVIEKNLPEILLGIDFLPPAPEFQMDFPALFIRGQLSGYIGDNDLKCIEHYFRNHKVVTIPGASHWVHAEQPALFLEAVLDFIGSEK